MLTFKGPKDDILALVAKQVTLEDQKSTLSDYIKLSVEQNSPFVSIFNDNGTYYSGAALVNGQLLPEKNKDKYILNLRELLSPSSQPFTVATGSTQAAAVTNQGPQLLRLLQKADQRKRENSVVRRERGQGPVRPLQNQPTLFAKTLVPQNSQTVSGYSRLYPQQTGFPLLPFGFQQQPTALEMQAARIAEQQPTALQIQVQEAKIADLSRTVAELRQQMEQLLQAAQQQAASLPQQKPSTRFEFQGPSLLTSEEMNPSGEQSQASTNRATQRPVKQAMSPDDLKDLILKGIPDADLIAMGVTAFDIPQAQQELAQDALEQLMIDEYEEKEELKRLQIEQDEALARQMQEQEQEEAKRRAQEETQKAQSATQQPVESDEESADDQVQDQQTGPGTLSNAARNRRKREMQKAAKAKKREKKEQEQQALEKAQKDKAAREEIERAQEKAQQDQADREASARATAQRLEEVTLAQQLEQPKPVNLQGQDSSKAKKPKKKGDQVSADSAALQAEKDRREREYLDRQAARNAKGQPAKILKKQDPQTIMKNILGDDLYNRMNTAGSITANMLEKLFRAQQNENNDFETRMVAARAIIKGPYSNLFNKGSYKSKKEEAIGQAIEMVTEGGYFEGIEAAIEYYLNQSSLAENDKKRLEYRMRHAKEECLLPDEPAALQIRNETVKKPEVKVQEKLKPQDSASILKSLKGQQQPKSEAERVVDQFNQGLKRWAEAVLIDSVKGYELLSSDSTRNKLIEELDWWTVPLGAMITTHAGTTELQKRLDLMSVTSYYAMLLNAVALSLSAPDKTLREETRKQLENIMQFLSKNAVRLEQGHGGQLQETDTKIEAEIQEKLTLIRTLIKESNKLLITRPEFFSKRLTDFQRDLLATEDVINDDTKVQFTSEQIKDYTEKLNDWGELLSILFDIPHEKLEEHDFKAQSSQFLACILLLRKMINAATTVPEFQQLLQLTRVYIELLNKAQHLKGQKDFDVAQAAVLSFESVVQANLNELRKAKGN